MAQTDSQKARDLRQEKKQGKDRGQGDSAQDTKKQTGNTKQSQDDISNRTGRSPSAKMNQEKQMGRDYRSQSNLAQTMGGNNQSSGLRGRIGDRLDQSIEDHDSRHQSRIGRAAEERAYKSGLSKAKSKGAAAAAEAAVRGESAKGVAESAAAAALEARKIQQLRLILLAIKGISAITLVAIIITIAIWGVQLFVGHMMGREKWQMSKIELPLAILCWVIITGIIIAVIVLIVALASVRISL